VLIALAKRPRPRTFGKKRIALTANGRIRFARDGAKPLNGISNNIVARGPNFGKKPQKQAGRNYPLVKLKKSIKR
jgi:hypothetical protein